MTRTLLIALLLSSTAALAAPHTMTHQGRLLDSTGVPLESTHAVGFSLFTEPAGGTPVWSEDHSLALTNGYFSVVLGDSEPLAPDVLADGDGHWLELTVDGSALADRVPLSSVPYALQASVALGLAEGSTIDASSVVANGDTVFDSAGNLDYDRLINVPDASDTLADLNCSTDQIAVFDGSGWVCADNLVDASNISGGILDVARLPVGGEASDVAAGNHTHAESHSRYEDSEAEAVANGVLSSHANSEDAHHAPYTDADARVAGRNYCFVRDDSGHDLYSSSWTDLNGLGLCSITSTGRPLKVSMDFSAYGIHHGGIRLVDSDGTVYGTNPTYGFDWVLGHTNTYEKRNIMRVIEVPEGDHLFRVQIRSQSNNRFLVHGGDDSQNYAGFNLLIEEL